MHTAFIPQTNEFWRKYFAQSGKGAISVFQGQRYQRGSGIGSIFKGLLRFILPIAKSAGQTLGKQALKTGARIATDVAEGRNFGEALAQHGAEGVEEAVKKITTRKRKAEPQKGKGIGKAPKVAKTINRRGVKKAQPPKKQPKKKGTKKTDLFGTRISYSQ